MKTTKPNDDKIDMFYGFWKYFGVMAVFFVGIAMFYWGSRIMINSWGDVRAQLGLIGHIVLAPLVAGTVLSWMSFVEFLRIIREN